MNPFTTERVDSNGTFPERGSIDDGENGPKILLVCTRVGRDS